MHIFLEFLSKFVILDDFSAREPTNVYIQRILHLKVIKYGKNLGEKKEKKIKDPTLVYRRWKNQGQNSKTKDKMVKEVLQIWGALVWRSKDFVSYERLKILRS